MTDLPLFVEPFAGGAAVALQLLGGPRCHPPVSWMGGKRQLAPVILQALGLAPGQGAERVVLCDAGPWGWVWPALIDPERAAAVAAVLRGWRGRRINDLWFELRDEGPREDPAESVAQWLVLQSRSASGAPVFWAGPDGATLLASSGSGAIVPAGQKGRNIRLWRGHDAGQRRPADQKGTNRAGYGGLVRIETLAERVEALNLVLSRQRIDVIAGRAEDLPADLPDNLTGALLSLGQDDPAVIAVLDGGATPEEIATVRGYVRRVTHRCVDVGSSPAVEMVRLGRWLEGVTYE